MDVQHFNWKLWTRNNGYLLHSTMEMIHSHTTSTTPHTYAYNLQTYSMNHDAYGSLWTSTCRQTVFWYQKKCFIYVHNLRATCRYLFRCINRSFKNRMVKAIVRSKNDAAFLLFLSLQILGRIKYVSALSIQRKKRGE